MIFKNAMVCPICEGEGCEDCNNGYCDYDDGQKDNYYVAEADLPEDLKEEREKLKKEYAEAKKQVDNASPPKKRIKLPKNKLDELNKKRVR